MSRQPLENAGGDDRLVTVGWILVLVVGASVIVYGLAFMANNLLGIVEIGLAPADVGLTPEQLAALPPRLIDYITHVQLALGGFIAAVGVAVSFFALGIRRRDNLAWWGAVIVSATWVVLTTPPHYLLGFAQLSHLGAVYGYVVVFAVGAYLSRPGAG